MLGRVFAVFLLGVSVVHSTSEEPDPLAAANHPDVLEKLASKGLHPSIALDEQSIYTKESDVFRDVHFPEAVDTNSNSLWRKEVNDMFQRHRPKNHPLWAEIKASPLNVLTNPGWLGEFYKRYQTAMHVTRCEVFKTPNLNTPLQRKRKILIFQDDDGPNNRSHHDDLERLFADFGGNVLPADWFSDPEDLVASLDEKTASFVKGVIRLYPASTGAWTMAELLSDEWLSTLADAFSEVYPWVAKHDYFDEIFTGHVEILHMMETVTLTEEVLARHPEKLDKTIKHGKEMCVLLDELWDNLRELVKNPEPFMSKEEGKPCYRIAVGACDKPKKDEL